MCYDFLYENAKCHYRKRDGFGSGATERNEMNAYKQQLMSKHQASVDALDHVLLLEAMTQTKAAG